MRDSWICHNCQLHWQPAEGHYPVICPKCLEPYIERQRNWPIIITELVIIGGLVASFLYLLILGLF